VPASEASLDDGQHEGIQQAGRGTRRSVAAWLSTIYQTVNISAF